MSKALDFDELLGELRELSGRVVALQIRDGRGEVFANAEGEFCHLEHRPPDEWSFQLGGDPPPERDGVRFIVASWSYYILDRQRVTEVRDLSEGMGAPIVLWVRMADDISFTLWPAMPPREQWTDLHDENR